MPVRNAEQATKIAESFIKKKGYGWVRPLKAVKQDGIWLVELDVGVLLTIVAQVKVNAESGEILEYEIPPATSP